MVQRIGHTSMKGRQKAAALLIALGPEISADVLKHFKESDIETLTVEIFQLEKITEEIQGQVLEECYHMALARNFITPGGRDYPIRFAFARDSDPAQLAQFISNEHPQTIALILSHLQPLRAAQAMAHLPTEMRTEVALRIATMERTPPEVVEQVEDVLKRKLSSVRTRDFTSVGGTHFLVNMLTSVDRSTQKQILEYLEHANFEVAAEIRKLMHGAEEIVIQGSGEDVLV